MLLHVTFIDQNFLLNDKGKMSYWKLPQEGNLPRANGKVVELCVNLAL